MDDVGFGQVDFLQQDLQVLVDVALRILSSITKDIDSSNDSTPLYALLRSKHVSNVFDGPPRRLLCVRYAYISSNTPAICLSIALEKDGERHGRKCPSG
jgi:hypothetical protein